MSLEARLNEIEEECEMVDELLAIILLSKARGDALREELKKLRVENKNLMQQEQTLLIAKKSVDPKLEDQIVEKIGEVVLNDYEP